MFSKIHKNNIRTNPRQSTTLEKVQSENRISNWFPTNETAECSFFYNTLWSTTIKEITSEFDKFVLQRSDLISILCDFW